MVYKLESSTYNVFVYMVDSDEELIEAYNDANLAEKDRRKATNPQTFFFYHLMDDNKTRVYFIYYSRISENDTVEEVLGSFVKYRINWTMDIENLGTMTKELVESYNKEHWAKRPEEAIKRQYLDICKMNNIEFTEEGLEAYKLLIEKQKTK